MKKGFASVFILLILSAVILVSLVLIEASCSFAAASTAENLCLLTGRSLLAEFQPALLQRYGLFMVRSNDTELSRLAQFYLTADLELSSSVLNMSCIGASADTSSFCGLDTDLFLQQVEKTGVEIAARNLITADRLKDMLDPLQAELDTSCSPEDIAQRLEAMIPEKQNDPTETALSASEKEARSLRAKVKAAQKETDIQNISNASIPAEEKGTLPSALLGIKSRKLLLCSLGLLDLSPGTVAADEYILDVCSTAALPMDNTVLQLEVEYILYGNFSDAKNQKAVISGLTAMRLPLNIAAILKDPSCTSAISSLTVMFPFLP
ncbi:MAG: hypothetical protein HUJ80_08280, partial [Firmicutes bacterium]|nr:hypothetical protein [Bacillota bacterium]